MTVLGNIDIKEIKSDIKQTTLISRQNVGVDAKMAFVIYQRSCSPWLKGHR